MEDSVLVTALEEENPSPLVEALEADEPIQYLSAEESSEATEQSRHLYGEEAPLIITEEDKQEADEYETARMFEENDLASIDATVYSAMQEGAQQAALNRAAYSSAIDRFIQEKFQFPGGLSESDLRQHQAEAVANDPEQVAMSNMQRVQQKLLIVQKLKNEVRKHIDDRSWLKDFIIKFGYAGIRAIPGYENLLAKDMLGKDGKFFTPLDNRQQFNKIWFDAISDATISPTQFELLLRAAMTNFEFALTPQEEMMEYLNAVSDMDITSAAIGVAADATIVAGSTARTVSAAVKGGKAGALKSLAKTTMPFVDFEKEGRGLLKVKKTTVDNLESQHDRKKFVGNKESAAEDVAKELGAPTDKPPTTEEGITAAVLGDPDIVNTLEAKTGRVKKSVLEDIIGDTTRPSESITESLVMTKPIITTKQYNNFIAGLKEGIRMLSKTSTIDGLKQELLKQPLLGKRLAEIINYFRPTDAVRSRMGAVIKALSGEDATVKQTSKAIKNDLFGSINAETKTSGGSVKGINASELKEDVKGNIIVRFRYGEYASNRSALAAGSKLVQKHGKYASEFEVVPLTSGKFALDIDLNTHLGFGQLLAQAVGKQGRPRWSTMFKSAVATITGTPDSIRLTDYVRSLNVQLLEGRAAIAKKAVDALSKAEKDMLQTILDATYQATTPGWYSPELLLAKGVPEKVVNAYSLLRSINDLNFLVLNDARRVQMIKDGYRVIYMNGVNRGYGRKLNTTNTERAITKLRTENRRVVIDRYDGKPYDINASVKSEELKPQLELGLVDPSTIKKEADKPVEITIESHVRSMLNTGQYDLVETLLSPKGHALAGSDVVYLVPKTAVQTEDLPAFVMNYVPGWRRYFDRKSTFVKQAVLENGKVVGVRTFFASVNATDLEKNTKEVEKIRQMIAARNLDLPDNIIQRHLEDEKKFGHEILGLNEKLAANSAGFKALDAEVQATGLFGSTGEAIEFFAQSGIDYHNIDNVLEAVRNNEVPNSVKSHVLFNPSATGMTKDTIDYYKQGAPFEAMLTEWEQRQLHRSGADVMDFDFSLAKTVDIDKTLQYLVNDMVQFGVMPEYESIYANYFHELYGNLISKKIKGGSSMKPSDMLKYVDLEKLYNQTTVPSEKVALSEAITAQKNYSLMRQIATPLDKKMAALGEGVLRTIGAAADALHVPEKIKHGVAGVFDWVMDKRPVAFAQSLAAHRFLGCLNPNQLVKNFLGPATLAGAAEMRYFPAAFKDVFVITHKLHKLDKDARGLILKLETALGTSSKETDMILKNMLLLDSRSSGIKGGLLGAARSDSKISRISLFFFDSADLGNKIFCHSIALRKFGFADKALTNALDIARVGSYADSLYLNMSKRGLSRLQQTKCASVFTQFMGYLFKYVETMCCDKMLTPWQRTRMITMSLLGCGAAGVLGYEGLNTLSFGLLTPEPDDSAVTEFTKRFIRDGGFDAILHASGSDISVQDLFAPNVLDGAFNFSEKNVMEMIAATPAVTTVTDYFSAMKDIIGTVYDMTFGTDTYASWSGLLDILLTKRETFSSVEITKRAYEMYRSGLRYSSNGQLMTEDNTKLQALLSFAGVGSQKLREIHLSQVERQKIKDRYADVLKEAMPYYLMAARGNRDAYRIAQGIINDPDLSDSQKMDLRNTLMKNAILQNLVPLELREAVESMKTKVKTGTSTYNP